MRSQSAVEAMLPSGRLEHGRMTQAVGRDVQVLDLVHLCGCAMRFQALRDFGEALAAGDLQVGRGRPRAVRSRQPGVAGATSARELRKMEVRSHLTRPGSGGFESAEVSRWTFWVWVDMG
jgi:hypothetical protein